MEKKSVVLFLLIVISSVATFAQKLDMSLSLGSHRAPNQRLYEMPREGFNLNFGLHYHLNSNWSLGTSINHASFTYYRFSAANTPLTPNLGSLPLEGEVKTDYMSFIINRKISLPWDLLVEAGTGVGLFVEENYFFDGIAFNEENQVFMGYGWMGHTNVGLHFPISYSITKVFSDKASLGLQGGWFLDKTGFVRGAFIGPRIGIYL